MLDNKTPSLTTAHDVSSHDDSIPMMVIPITFPVFCAKVVQAESNTKRKLAFYDFDISEITFTFTAEFIETREKQGRNKGGTRKKQSRQKHPARFRSVTQYSEKLMYTMRKNIFFEKIALRHILPVLMIMPFIPGLATASGPDGSMKSIQAFGVLPENTPEVNREKLQAAIDWASASGAALYVTPVENGYRVATGLILRKNVSLIGAHGPTGRGTQNPQRNMPTGSLFVITDTEHPFITVESATQIRGIQFWYPEQAHRKAADIIPYPPTIQMAAHASVQGVTLACLTFYGEYTAMDFRSKGQVICEQILIEHCYGYPLGGEFIAIDRCYDIPRILHCHVNPANMREFGRSFSKEVIDRVIAQKTFTFWINRTDNAQLIDVFTFGVYGGVYLGDESYGQLTNFNLDCVTIGIYKSGTNTKNRNWQIAQGSIIANVGEKMTDIHPVVIEGKGHTALTNVEAFSGDNPALTTRSASYDYLTINGDETLTVSLFGCRMQGYTADNPITINNPKARIRAVACIDRNEQFFDLSR
jgi:hypothetical protein